MKTFNCPFCKEKMRRELLVKHIEKEHDEEIPEGFTAYRLVYDIVNDHPDHRGTCTICGKPTKWNEKRQKYERLCGDPKCYAAVKKTYQKRMLKVYNKTSLMDDPNHLEKMLAGRKISGKYKWSDGKVFTYTGTYEKNFMEFLDKVLEFKSNEILAPGPVLNYEYKGKQHMWITDFLILPYNLIVEIKDGGEGENANPNMKYMPSYRKKQVAKEKMITNLGKYSYIRLTNNEFNQFLSLLAELKMNVNDKDDKPLYRIHEDACLQENINIIFSDDDVVKNLDQWKKGSIKILFITGLSGSGKSTLARKLQSKYKAEYISLDDVLNDIFKKKYTEPIIWYNKTHKEPISELKWPKSDKEFYRMIFSIVIEYINYKIKTSDKKLIVEGIQIPGLYEISPDLFKKSAIIIKSTSYLSSAAQGLKRDVPEIISNFANDIKGHFGTLFSFNRNLKDKINDFENGIKEETELDENFLSDIKNNIVGEKFQHSPQKRTSVYNAIIKSFKKLRDRLGRYNKTDNKNGAEEFIKIGCTNKIEYNKFINCPDDKVKGNKVTIGTYKIRENLHKIPVAGLILTGLDYKYSKDLIKELRNELDNISKEFSILEERKDNIITYYLKENLGTGFHKYVEEVEDIFGDIDNDFDNEFKRQADDMERMEKNARKVLDQLADKHSKSFVVNKTSYTTTDPDERELTVVNIYTPKVKMANKNSKKRFKEMCYSLKEELDSIHSDQYDIVSFFEDPDNVNEGYVVGIASKTSK